jgi:putative transposase
MIKTFKIKHNRDFTNELKKAKQVAEFSIGKCNLTTKDVKHFGLKAVISNQIIRKYKKAVSVKRVKMPVPNQSLILKGKWLWCSPLSIGINLFYLPSFEKVNQIEVGDKYVYVTVTVKESKEYKPNGFIGVDLNATGDIVVCSNGKLFKCTCGHVAHADLNAAINIASGKDMKRLLKSKGLIGSPHKALSKAR